MKRLVALLMLLPTIALADISVTYVWTAPVGWSAVEYYACQTRAFGGEWGECGAATIGEYITIIVDNGIQDLQLRVAGVDVTDRQGPWSPPSDPYSEAGPPSAPGMPTIDSVVIQ